jgi:hypothetical protein
MAEWSVLLPQHHPGYLDRATFHANPASTPIFLRNLTKPEEL